MRGVVVLIIIIVIVIVMGIAYALVDFPTHPFDVVYTWVDEYDPERDKYTGKIVDESNSVYRYNNTNELLYSIKSLKKHCKAVSKIYIVVKDGQIPKFIDFSDPSIKLINHSEIIPSSALPTFNSCAIELCLHKIPNLLDHYVYFNDDIFVNKKLKWRDLFSWWNGMPKVNIVKWNILGIKDDAILSKHKSYDFFVSYDNTIRIANKLLNINITGTKLPHTPSVCYKPWEYEIENLLKRSGLWEDTINSKFRETNNIILNNGFRTVFYLWKGSASAHWGDTHMVLVEKCKINTGSGLFFCVNNISQKCQGAFKEYMEAKTA